MRPTVGSGGHNTMDEHPVDNCHSKSGFNTTTDDKLNLSFPSVISSVNTRSVVLIPVIPERVPGRDK